MSTIQAEAPVTAAMEWGSDAIAAILRALDLKYVALVPGASYRGLHDSIVNYLGNENPEMLLCLHEEHSVAIAHGYARVTGKPMLAIVHSNVGLMHATMAFFNAWCDRVPVLILGANGPVDAAKRRPWIDWIHTTQDMGALVRGYTKWDDQPGSPQAAIESVLRAYQIASTLPYGPTFVVLDADVQERPLSAPIPLPPVDKFVGPEPAVPSPNDVLRVLGALRDAKRPVIISGRGAWTQEKWDARVALAETLEAQVVSHFSIGASFPTDHPLHVGPTSNKAARAALREADVILDLDVPDLAGVLRTAAAGKPLAATVISASLDRYNHNGWSMDYQALPALDVNIAASPDALVAELLAALGSPQRKAQPSNGSAQAAPPPAAGGDQTIGIEAFSKAVSSALAGQDICYTRIPAGVKSSDFVFHHPLDFIGRGGGGGVGIGCGMAVGAALALRETGSSRLPVCVTGDGDFLMGHSALWTAVAHQIPLLVIVANNHSYFNDEVHQERLAIMRKRPVERKWIGQRIDGPAPDVTGFAKAQGAVGIGPITRRDDIAGAIAEGVKHVRDGKVCVIDVIVLPEYAAGVAEGVIQADVLEQNANYDRG